MLWSAFLFCSLQAAPVDSLKPSVHADSPMLSGRDSLLLKQLDEVVITGSREFQRRRESPVAVHVVNRRALQGIQANNALEGLRLIPGLRTETNCQTCHYTQVRMNGLPGGYSQILWNGRPVVSSLLGLYGLDMWPASMVERIEVVRGGGSTMYGSNAVGGTVNIITRTPDQNGFSLGSTYRRVGGGASDGLVDGELSRLFAKGQGAVQVLYNHRSRQWWDANGDGLSELPKTKADNLSLNAYWRPKAGGRWNLSLQTMREYRYGGSMVFGPVYLASQAEERKTRAKLGHLDYRKTWNQGRSNVVAYTAWQGVQREHYTGIFPDSPAAILQHLASPPYGGSNALTGQTGIQVGHRWEVAGRPMNITAGMEYLSDRVTDSIPAYRFLVDQNIRDWGQFAQIEWFLHARWRLLSGLRIDIHSMLKQPVWSPRLALLFKKENGWQWRLGYASGFRAPQAFDTDLHTAFAGGGVSRVTLDTRLGAEYSHSFHTSLGYEKATANWVYGFDLEGFGTRLNDAFVLENIGSDPWGEQLLKRNGNGATVAGISAEGRAQWGRRFQWETSWTWQFNRWDVPVQVLSQAPATRLFMRTPNFYGYSQGTWWSKRGWTLNLNLLLTGPMWVPRFGGSEANPNDLFFRSPTMVEWNGQWTKKCNFKGLHTDFEFFAGFKNLLNRYQREFDRGPGRDSNFIYGPSTPRTWVLGFRIQG
ncbi:MAG: TonB-dependent receptor plug domain-containing protein [Bacteroidia bacterium]